MSVKLLVGLGNPGPSFSSHRHNVGAWLIEQLASIERAPLKTDNKFLGSVASLNIDSSEVKLLIPTTYMNESGNSVRAVSNFYKILPEDIYVVHDELDLPVGTVRFKNGGGLAGHNGLKSIHAHLHSQNFKRLRIGISHPGDKNLVARYVLQPPNASEKTLIEDAITYTLRLLPEILSDKCESAIAKLHTFPN